MKCIDLIPVEPGMLICAFRYALGRSTYIVSEVADCISKNKDRMPQTMLQLIIKEISEAEYLGMDMDERVWVRLRQELREYINDGGYKR